MIDGAMSVLRGDVPSSLHKAEECVVLTEERGYSNVAMLGFVFRDWAKFRLRPERDTLSRLRDLVSVWHDGGHRQWWPWLETLLAEALIVDQQAAEGLRRMDDVLSWIAKSGARQFESIVWSTKGDALRALALSDEAEAEACYRKAIEVACAQSAKSWELRAATRLARLWHSQGKSAEARDLLAPIYGWFTEGFDTADLKDAKALLEELA
jgi:predicted ATPase